MTHLVLTQAVENWGDYISFDSYKPGETYVESSWKLDFSNDFSLISWIRAIPNPDKESTSRFGILFALTNDNEYASGSGDRFIGIKNGKVYAEARGLLVEVQGSETGVCANVADGTWRHWRIIYTKNTNDLKIYVDDTLCLTSAEMTSNAFNTLPAPTTSQKVSLGYMKYSRSGATDPVPDLLHGAFANVVAFPNTIIGETELTQYKGTQPNDTGMGIQQLVVSETNVKAYVYAHYPATGVTIGCKSIPEGTTVPTVDEVLASTTEIDLSGFTGNSAITLNRIILDVPSAVGTNVIYCASKVGDIKTAQNIMENMKITYHSDFETIMPMSTSNGNTMYDYEHFWVSSRADSDYSYHFGIIGTGASGPIFCTQPYPSAFTSGSRCQLVAANKARWHYLNKAAAYKYSINTKNINDGTIHYIGFNHRVSDHVTHLYLDKANIFEYVIDDTYAPLQPNTWVFWKNSEFGTLNDMTIKFLRVYHKYLQDAEMFALADNFPIDPIVTVTVDSVTPNPSSIDIKMKITGVEDANLYAYVAAYFSNSAIPTIDQVKASSASYAIHSNIINTLSVHGLASDQSYKVYMYFEQGGNGVITQEEMANNVISATTTRSIGCIGFKGTSTCSPYGTLDPSLDLSCSALVPSSSSGYCLCDGNVKVNPVYCNHDTFTCNDACVSGSVSFDITGWYTKAFRHFSTAISSLPTPISAYRSMNPTFNLYYSSLNIVGNSNNAGNYGNIPYSTYEGMIQYHSGIFTATTSGTYQIGVTQDDVLMVLIDSFDMNNNIVYYTFCGPNEVKTSVDLVAGEHKIIVLFGNGGGGFSCIINIYDPQGNNVKDNVKIGLGNKHGINAYYTNLDDDNTCDWPSSSIMNAGTNSGGSNYVSANQYPDEFNFDFVASDTTSFSSSVTLPANFYSVFTTHLQIPVTGSYTFTLTTNGVAIVIFNGVTQLEVTECGEKINTFTASLTTGLLPITIRYRSNSATSKLQLEWESTDASITKQIIPNSYLYIEDIDIPTYELSSPYNGLNKVTDPYAIITLSSSKPINNLPESAITVEGATISEITKVHSLKYTFKVTPSSSVSSVKVYIAANGLRCINALSNTNPSNTINIQFGYLDFTATIRLKAGFALSLSDNKPSQESNVFTIGLDSTEPNAYVSLPTGTVNTPIVNGELYFSEEMAYVDQGILAITGGNVVSNSFIPIPDTPTNTAFSFKIQIESSSFVYVRVSMGTTMYYDIAGNAITSFNGGSFVYKSDYAVPLPTISTSYYMPVSSTTVPITITFDADITGLTIDSFTSTAGTISSVTGSGMIWNAIYTFSNPSSNTITGSVKVNANSVKGAGDIDNAESNLLTITYSPQVMTITSITPINGKVDVPANTQTIRITFDSTPSRGSGSAIFSSGTESSIVYDANSSLIEFDGSSVIFRISQSLIGDRTYTLVIPSYFFIDTTTNKYFNGFTSSQYNFHVACSMCGLPTFTTDLPSTLNSNIGFTISLQVVVTAVPVATYQWYLDNLPIEGAISTTYSKVLTSTDFGVYTVKATNTYGTSTSNSLIIMKDDVKPIITITPVAEGATCATSYAINLSFNKEVSSISCDAFETSSTITCVSTQLLTSTTAIAAFTITPTGYNTLTIKLLSDKICDTFNNCNEETTYDITVDCVPPSIQSYSPAHNSIDIQLDAVIQLTFSETIQFGNTFNVQFMCIGTNTCNAITVDRTGISLSEDKKTVVINKNSLFSPEKEYTLSIASGLVMDMASNIYTGLTAGEYKFTTSAASAPSLSTRVPASNSINVPLNGNIELTFDMPVQYGTGNIILRAQDQDDISISSLYVVIQSNIVTIVYSNLISSTLYNVIIPSGVFTETTSNIAYNGIAAGEYTFTTVVQPIVSSYSPINGAIDIAINEPIQITYNIAIQKNSGSIVFTPSSGNAITIDVMNPVVTISEDEKTLIITPSLLTGLTYTVTLPEGIVVSKESNIPCNAVTDYTISTPSALTYTVSPVESSENLKLNFVITLTFNRDIASLSTTNSVTIAGTNTITTVGTISTSNPKEVQFSFTENLTANSQYYVSIPADLVTDIKGVKNTVGIFTYHTASAPIVSSSDPSNNASNVSINKVFVFTFSSTIVAGTGSISFTASGKPTITYSITDGNCQINGNTLTISLSTGTTLENGSTYTLDIPSGLVQNNYDIGNTQYMLVFSTPSFPTISNISPPTGTPNLVPSGVVIILTFSQAMQKGTGSIQFVGPTTINIDVTSTQVVVDNTVVTITPTSILTPGTYNLVIPANCLSSTSGAPYQGLNSGEYSFTTLYAADISKFYLTGTSVSNGLITSNLVAGATAIWEIHLKNSNDEDITSLTNMVLGGSSLSDLSITATMVGPSTIPVTIGQLTQNGIITISCTPESAGSYTLTIQASCGTVTNTHINHSPFTSISVIASTTAASKITYTGSINVQQKTSSFFEFHTYDLYNNPTDPTDYSSAFAVDWSLPLSFNSITDGVFSKSSTGIFRYTYTTPIIDGNIDYQTISVSFKFNSETIPNLSQVTFTNPYNAVCPHNCNMRTNLGECTANGCTCISAGYYPEAGCTTCPSTTFDPLVECSNHGSCSASLITKTASCTCDINYKNQNCGTLDIITGENPNEAADDSMSVILTKFTISGISAPVSEENIQSIKLAIAHVMSMKCCYDIRVTSSTTTSYLKASIYQNQVEFDVRVNVPKDTAAESATLLTNSFSDGSFVAALVQQGITASSVTVNSEPVNNGPLCTDNVQNGLETDIDCGGSTCSPCPNEKNCLVDTDCQSGKCDLETMKCIFVFPVWAIILIVVVVIIIIAGIVFFFINKQKKINAKKPKLSKVNKNATAKAKKEAAAAVAPATVAVTAVPATNAPPPAPAAVNTPPPATTTSTTTTTAPKDEVQI
ncbi:hypothetical protein WA158_004573 [Blastocystis sp. Blastoise]